MADTLRVRGAEVQFRLTRNGTLEKTLTAVKSFTFEAMIEVKQEGYVGESNDRFDDIFKGCQGTVVFNPESQDAWTLMAFIRDRAARRVAQANHRINTKFVANMPDGTRPSITVPDLKFENIPFNVSARDAYVEINLSWKSEDFTIETT
jgi:hypothetical protein